METSPVDSITSGSFRDDLIAALLAFGAGLVAGLPTLWLTGMASFFLIENDCSGEYMCGLGALVWAVLIALIAGVLAFATAAVRSVRKHAMAGRRLRVGVLTFAGLPVMLVVLFSVIGFF